MIQLSERTLGDWLEHWAAVSPDKEYLVYSDRNHTWFVPSLLTINC